MRLQIAAAAAAMAHTIFDAEVPCRSHTAVKLPVQAQHAKQAYRES